MRLGVYEILEGASKLSKVEERAAFLKKHEHKVLWQILNYMFDPKVEFALPPGTPPYSECDPVNAETFLYQHQRKLQLFRKGGEGDKIKQSKREMLFIELLEMVHPKDAVIILGMKDKKMPDEYKKITKTVVQKAFPGLVQEDAMRARDNKKKRPNQIKNFKYIYDDDNVDVKPASINKNRAKRLDRALKKKNIDQIIEYMD